jgi:hypothetical protein
VEQQVVFAEDSLDSLQVQVEVLNKFYAREPDEPPLAHEQEQQKIQETNKKKTQ